MADEHTTTVHVHPLNDGGAWYRVTCTCGWANRDPDERIYSEEQAKAVADDHRERA